jgi:kynurenine formamidase
LQAGDRGVRTNEEIGQDPRAGTAGGVVALKHLASEEGGGPRQRCQIEPAVDQKRLNNQIPVREMILPLVVIDETPLLATDPVHALTVDDIGAWEREHGRVPAGSFVALRTDMYKDFTPNPERFRRSPFPAWSLGAIRFLYEQRGVVATGHESMDADTTDEMASETWLLRNGHWQIEVMANLDQVPPTGAILVTAWPKVEKGLGFPVRAFAIVP